MLLHEVAPAKMISNELKNLRVNYLFTKSFTGSKVGISSPKIVSEKIK
jgi:hypothetical protein